MLLGSETSLLRMSHVLLGKIVGRYGLGMKVQSRRSGDAGSRLGHDTGLKWKFPHLRSYCYGAEQRLYPHCSSWMYPHHLHQPCCPFRDESKPMFKWRTFINLDLVISWIQKIKTKYPCKSKASGVNLSPQIDVALLQDFSAWVCKAALLQFPLCCWKNTPWKQESLGMEWFSSVLWQFSVWFLSSWLSKAYFLNTVWKAVSFVDVTNRKVVCSTICRGHVKAFRHSFLVDLSSQPSPARQVNGPGGVEGQARPGSYWNGKPIQYARGAKPFSLMVFSSKAYTRETIPIFSMFPLWFLFFVTITRPE